MPDSIKPIREPAERSYPCGVDAENEVTCDRCPDPDGCIDASYRPMSDRGGNTVNDSHLPFGGDGQDIPDRRGGNTVNEPKALPGDVNLCPVHADEFYMPDCPPGYGCPECERPMVQYVPVAEVERLRELLARWVAYADAGHEADAEAYFQSKAALAGGTP
jgi:hypothetical protein